jgi:hypothetical protein
MNLSHHQHCLQRHFVTAIKSILSFCAMPKENRRQNLHSAGHLTVLAYIRLAVAARATSVKED